MDALMLRNTLENENDSITAQMIAFTRWLPDTTQVRLFSTFVECHLLAEMRHSSNILRNHECAPIGMVEKLNREVSRLHCELQHFVSVWGRFESRSWPRAFSADLKRLITMFDGKVSLEEDWLLPVLEGMTSHERTQVFLAEQAVALAPAAA